MDYSKIIRRLRSRLDEQRGELKRLLKEKELLAAQQTQLGRTKKCQEDARDIIQSIAQDVQNSIAKNITELVELCLCTIFEDDYKFVLEFTKKRNKTEAEFFIIYGDNKYSALDASGGERDTIAFALRIALWNINRPKTTSTIILDEPFKFFSGQDLQNRAGILLKLLSDKLKIQFIVVSDQENVAKNADKRFTITKKCGISIVETDK